MAKTKERLYDTADTMKPYVDRALHDDELHDNLKEAFKAARDVYAELLGNRNLTATAMRAATDQDVQDNLKRAVDETRRNVSSRSASVAPPNTTISPRPAHSIGSTRRRLSFSHPTWRIVAPIAVAVAT